MKVNELLKNKLQEDDSNFVHADNEVTHQYGVSGDEGIAFRDECGILWIDYPQMDEPYASDDDDQPSEEKPILFNESMQCWLWLLDERGEWYRLENEDRERFVLCSGSIQHTPYERDLTVVGYIDDEGQYRDGAPEGDWIVAPPTPYSPKAILH